MLNSDKSNSQMRKVQLLMLLLTTIVAAVALLSSGKNAMLAACWGGLAQILAVRVYAIVANRSIVLAPRAVFFRHVLADIAKIVTALGLLAFGFLLFVSNVVWLLVAFAIVAIAAYVLVLLIR